MDNVLAITGGALGAVLTVAQLTPVDAPIADMLVKAGAVGIVAALFYMFMRLHFKALKEMSDTHKEISIRQAQASVEAAAVVAKDSKEAISLLVAGHKEAVDRIEQAHMSSASKYDAGTDRLVTALNANARRCGEVATLMEKVSSRSSGQVGV